MNEKETYFYGYETFNFDIDIFGNIDSNCGVA